MSHVNVLTDEKNQKIEVVGRSLQLVGSTDVTPKSTSTPALLLPPVEIILRIIELGSEDDERDFPILISHVCGKLRDIALAHPLLWTSVIFLAGIQSHDEVEARLQRSQDVPIDISIPKLETQEDADKMLSLLYPHVGRWRSLSVEVWEAPAADALMRALVDPAPKLQSLSLAGFGHGPFNPFGGKTPSLKNLSAKSMPMLWDSPLFSTIESLYIHCPSWSSQSILGKWRKLQKLTIRSDAIQPLVFNFPIAHVDLPDLECLELNGVTEEDIVRLLSHVEMPNLSRLLFTHIKDSPNQVSTTIFPLSNVRYLRLHATEMCQDNLLNVLRKVRNLEHISFEDSSPIPTFIHELTPNPKDASSWIIPNVTMFKVIAFEKDNAHRMYDDTDIAEALQKMIHQRAPVTPMTVRMCIFEGERDDVTRHAAEWDRERPYKSERQYTLDSRW